MNKFKSGLEIGRRIARLGTPANCMTWILTKRKKKKRLGANREEEMEEAFILSIIFRISL